MESTQEGMDLPRSTTPTTPTTLPSIREEDGTELDETAVFSTLALELERMKETANLLYHRVNTLQDLLEQDRFELSEYKLIVKDASRQEKVREFLTMIGVKEEELTMGVFLNALNHWLIQADCIDLNDFQICMTPLLSAAFYKPPGLKKMPYPLLLLSLPKMFN